MLLLYSVKWNVRRSAIYSSTTIAKPSVRGFASPFPRIKPSPNSSANSRITNYANSKWSKKAKLIAMLTVNEVVLKFKNSNYCYGPEDTTNDEWATKRPSYQTGKLRALSVRLQREVLVYVWPTRCLAWTFWHRAPGQRAWPIWVTFLYAFN